VLAATARDIDLPTLADTRKLEMIPSLEKGGELLKAIKKLGNIYGLDIDASLAGVQAKVLSASGDSATMEVSYPLLGKSVHFEMQLLRRKGRWYPADTVRKAERDLSTPLQGATPS
jgi:hypothetical protein